MTDIDLPLSEDTKRANPALFRYNALPSISKPLTTPSVASSTGKQALQTSKGNKYNAVRTYSEMCGRTFDSKAEARRGEELKLLEQSGVIHNLEYQVKFTLNKKPRITVAVDFAYDVETLGEWDKYYEDVKGVLTRDSRTKYAWLQQKFGIEVELIRR